MHWPPRVGDVLPRADQAWFERIKLDEWILGTKGHGLEWERVWHVGPADWERIWEAISNAAINATIVEVRDRSPFGVSCGIEAPLTICGRTAMAIISWHYADEWAMPRLVTAYATL